MGQMPNLLLSCVAAATIGNSFVAIARQSQKPQATEGQTYFREDEPLQKHVPLTGSVIDVLLQTELAKQGLDYASNSQRQNPGKMFRAAEVHLTSPDQVDLVVIGKSPMSGADAGWFWVLRSAHKQPKVVLSDSGNSLELMNSRTNGYKDIRIFAATAGLTKHSMYHFNGQEYILWKETTKHR